MTYLHYLQVECGVSTEKTPMVLALTHLWWLGSEPNEKQIPSTRTIDASFEQVIAAEDHLFAIKKDDNFHCHKVVYDDVTEEPEILNLDGDGVGDEKRDFRLEVQGEGEEQPAPALPAPAVLQIIPRRRRNYRLKTAQELEGAGAASGVAKVGAADLFSTTFSLEYDREAGKRQTYTEHYSRTRSSPPQVRNYLLKYLSIIIGGRSRKPHGALPPDSDPESYPRCACPACSYSVRDSNGNWSDVHVRHAGFPRCYLDHNSDQVFMATIVRPWSRTLRLAEERRRREIEELVSTSLEQATTVEMEVGAAAEEH